MVLPARQQERQLLLVGYPALAFTTWAYALGRTTAGAMGATYPVHPPGNGPNAL